MAARAAERSARRHASSPFVARKAKEVIGSGKGAMRSSLSIGRPTQLSRGGRAERQGTPPNQHRGCCRPRGHWGPDSPSTVILRVTAFFRIRGLERDLKDLLGLMNLRGPVVNQQLHRRLVVWRDDRPKG